MFALEKKTEKNSAYRKVIQTTKQMQLVLMCLTPDEDIPAEVHRHSTQFIRVEKGRALVRLDKKEYKLSPGDSIIIEPNVEHYVTNQGKTNLHLYTIYTPPEHKEGLVQRRQKRLGP